MSGPARLAVHVGRDVPAGLAAVLSALAPDVEAVAASELEPLPENVRAHLYCSDVLPRRPVGPYAVWRVDGADVDDLPGVPVLGGTGSGRARPGELHVSLREWPDRARPVLPFTRARYRTLRGLPDVLLGEARADAATWGAPGDRAREVPLADWPVLAALSSAVVAADDELWTALAWAAPAVTDPVTARRLALVPDEDVLVGDDAGARRRLAAELAADEARAARLARRGWQTARSRLPGAVAAELRRRLGLGGPAHGTAPGLTAALDSLGTPPGSLVRRRARDATADLPGAVTSGWRPDREEHP